MSHVDHTRGFNISRFFVTYRSVGWALLVATLVWGALGYVAMPKRKDPYFKIRKAVAVAVWPGAPPDQVEKLVIEPLEAKLASATSVATIESSARTGVGIVTITMREDLSFEGVDKALDDVELKLRDVTLPPGSQPVRLEKDFGDTNILLYSVGSPEARDAELDARAVAIQSALATVPPASRTSAYVVPFTLAEDSNTMRAAVLPLATAIGKRSASAPEVRTGAGFALVATDAAQEITTSVVELLLTTRGKNARVHADAWRGFVLTAPAELRARLGEVRGAAYTLGQLDRFAEELQRRVRATPGVAKVIRTGTVPEQVFIEFDRSEIEGSSVHLDEVARALAAHDVSSVRATTQVGPRTVAIDTSGVYRDEKEIARTIIGRTTSGEPIRLGERFDVVRGYEEPRRTSHTLSLRDTSGRFVRGSAVTLGIQQLPDAQIADVGARVERAMADARLSIPEDVRLEKVTDQPKQVEEKIGSFVRSLFEASVIVVVVGFLGFWEWRSATVLALSVPVTLALTFGLMKLFGLDIQQISLAALIISLGLLVDDPVVANDAIRAELDRGEERSLAAWLGPTKLASAILFATLTNIAAYLPFLLNKGDVGRYIFALPIVLTISLVASRIVSMTFIPLFGYALLRKSSSSASSSEGRVARSYRRLVTFALGHRKAVLVAAALLLVVSSVGVLRLRLLFFPKDLMFQAYVDVFLPEDATVEATEATLERAQALLAEIDEEMSKKPDRHGRHPLARMAAWAGEPAPRFWYSLSPKESFPNYGQIVFEVSDPHDTEVFAEAAQERLSRLLPGAHVDVKRLENGPPVTYPVELRVSGENPKELRRVTDGLLSRIRALPEARRVRDDWGTDALRLQLAVDPGELDQSGLAPADVAMGAFVAFNGLPVAAVLGDRRIPVVMRERRSDKGTAADTRELSLPSPTTGSWVPAIAIARTDLVFAPARIARRDQRRTMTVIAFPAAGVLPSELMKKVHPILKDARADLAPGYNITVGGAEEKTNATLLDSAIVAVVSVLAIYFMLLLQFRSARKPLVVFAAIPFGVAAAISSVVGMGAPFGFTAILGTISLIGVIVSHVIVLFDGIEHGEREGLPLREALVSAGVQRLRPVAITVGATVLGLVPLAAHGGPLWEPLCYAQIGGLTMATLVTLVLVPVLYAVFVEDLGFLHWGQREDEAEAREPPPAAVGVALKPMAAE